VRLTAVILSTTLALPAFACETPVQPVDASVVHGDPAALCHAKFGDQTQIAAEYKEIYMNTCIRQLRIWNKRWKK